MYYNTKTEQILNSVPLNGYLPEGSLVQGLDLATNDIQKLCGILSVISDTPEQPENTVEDESQRVVSVEENGVSIVRTWIPAPVIVPPNISARQVRLWLIDNNINLNSVEEAINTIQDEKLKEKTRVEWEYAPYIERHHPLIETLGAHLNLTTEQIDQGFVAAANL
jgi:hypothetical protein